MTSVTQPRPEYTQELADYKKNTDAIQGERVIKAAGTEYLPPLATMCCTITFNKEDDTQDVSLGTTITSQGLVKYNKYKSNAFFYGATGRTVDGLVGLIFSKPATYELSDSLAYLSDNADGKGSTLRSISKAMCEEAFPSIRYGFLVDFPNVQQRVSRLDAEQQNLRPKILSYYFNSIINWHFEVINNVNQLSLVVLKEPVSIRSGFKIENKHQYRVLELIEGVYTQAIYGDDGELISPAQSVLINGSPSNEIPFFGITPKNKKKSVINDLVDTNLHHYRISADYGGFLHSSSFVVYTETGATGSANNIIGPGAKWNNSNADASFGILQPDGNADSLRLALKDDEERMAALGAEQLKPRVSGAESAEAKSLDQVAQNSTTADIAITVSNELTKAINFCARWLGVAEDVEYKLNTDYNPQGLDAQKLTALVGAWQGGAISYDTFYDNLQKGEIARNGVTSEQEQALLVDNNI